MGSEHLNDPPHFHQLMSSDLKPPKICLEHMGQNSMHSHETLHLTENLRHCKNWGWFSHCVGMAPNSISGTKIGLGVIKSRSLDWKTSRHLFGNVGEHSNKMMFGNLVPFGWLFLASALPFFNVMDSRVFCYVKEEKKKFAHRTWRGKAPQRRTKSLERNLEYKIKLVDKDRSGMISFQINEWIKLKKDWNWLSFTCTKGCNSKN